MDTGAFGRELRESGEKHRTEVTEPTEGIETWRWWTPELWGDNCRIRESRTLLVASPLALS
jgi:hypothetical protein